MQYRKIRYTLRLRVQPGQWLVAIHPEDVELSGRIITGTREQAEKQAHSQIDRWLASHPAQAAESLM
jgi:hypothetical protein